MKYLKLFEHTFQYNNIKFTYDEWDDFWGQEPQILKFEKREYDIIRNFFGKKRMRLEPFDKVQYITANFSGSAKYYSVAIHKLSDEWFLCNISISLRDSKVPEIGKDGINTIQYKCDQIGGLIELLTYYLQDIPDSDPTEYIANQDESEYLKKLRMVVMKKVNKLSKEDLEKLNNKL